MPIDLNAEGSSKVLEALDMFEDLLAKEHTTGQVGAHSSANLPSVVALRKVIQAKSETYENATEENINHLVQFAEAINANLEKLPSKAIPEFNKGDSPDAYLETIIEMDSFAVNARAKALKEAIEYNFELTPEEIDLVVLTALQEQYPDLLSKKNESPNQAITTQSQEQSADGNYEKEIEAAKEASLKPASKPPGLGDGTSQVENNRPNQPQRTNAFVGNRDGPGDGGVVLNQPSSIGAFVGGNNDIQQAVQAARWAVGGDENNVDTPNDTGPGRNGKPPEGPSR